MNRSLTYRVLGFFAWLALCLSAALTGMFFHPGEWHRQLQKPAWNPPNFLFPPVWTVLYISMAVAAWRVWRIHGFRGAQKALGLFFLQLAFNALWSPLFFGLHEMGWGLVDILLLEVAIFATILAFAQKDRWAAVLMIPYLAWVSFASFLNFTLWRLNG